MSAFDTLWTATGEVAAKAFFGSVVTIKRGSRTTAAVTAQRFDGSGKMENDDGTTTSVVYCEWIIPVVSYLFTGLGTVEPKTGDRIIDDQDIQYEVAPVLDMRQVEGLPGGTEWLLRTRRVGG